MKQSFTFVTTLLALALLCCSPPAWSEDTPGRTHPVTLTAAGSGVNLGITRLLAKAFAKQHPEITVDVPGSIGTRGAIKAVADGAIPLGLASRSLRGEEKTLGIVQLPYARVAIVVGAHADVPEDTITSRELIQVFKGTKSRWKNGNTIIVQAREKSDSGFLVLKNAIPGFKEAYVESHQARRWTLYFTDQDANSALCETPDAIGVTDLGMIATEHLNIKVLKLDGIAPDPENVMDGTYPLSRQLSFIYRPDTLSSQAQLFLDFTATEIGRTVLQTNGYIPLR